MIDMRYKPSFLPQITAPVDIVLGKFNEEGINYDFIKVNPHELESSQGIAFSDGVGESELDENNPIWIVRDNKICDGHHRFVRALETEKPLFAIRIDLEFKDACRLLNKIQDIYDYEEQQKMEEVVGQDIINGNNEINGGVSYSEFLKSLEENNFEIQKENNGKNDKVLIGYRKLPINEESTIGNFFMLNPIEGFSKYQIEFENLLETDDMGLQFKDGQIPTDILAKAWFPNINFEKLSKDYDIPVLNLKNKAIAERAKILNYDGIKYGDILLQGLK